MKKSHFFARQGSLYLSLLLLVLTPFHALLSVGLLDGLGLRDSGLFSLAIMAWKEAFILLLLGLAFCLGDFRKNLFWIGIFTFVFFGVFLTVFLHSGEADFLARLFYGGRTEFSFLLLFVAWSALFPIWSQEERGWLLRGAFWSGLTSLGFGTLLFFTGHELLTFFGYREDWSTFYLGQAPAFCQKEGGTDFCRLQSGFADANRFAGYLLSLGILILLMIKRPIWKGVALLILLGLLVGTLSSSAWLALIVMVAVYFLQRWKFFPSLVLAGALLGLLSLGFLPKIASQFDLSLSSVEHFVRMQAAWQSFLEHPWGQGLATAGPASYKLGQDFIPESWFLQVLVNTGILGFALFFAIGLFLANRWKSAHSLFLPLLVGVLCQNLLLHTLEDAGVYVLWIFLIMEFLHLSLERVEGEVVKGEGRGQGLGFPTVNIKTKKVPNWPLGVYAVRVQCGPDSYLGAMNWGSRPTFNEEQAVLEVYLLDFQGELYGATLSVDPIKKIREIRKFPDRESLAAQIEKDVAAVKALN